MAAGNTYVAIASQTLASAAATVTFSSIPATYTDLVLVVQSKDTTGGEYPYIQFNGDTASNYSQTILHGNGSSAGSSRYSSATYIYTSWMSFNTANGQITRTNIMNYANTTTNKTVLIRADAAGSGTEATVGLWRSTAAINSIAIKSENAATYAIGSTFALYGILAA